MNARQLVIDVPLPTIQLPNGGQVPVVGSLHHPLPDSVDVCEVIRRLAPIVPDTATWYVRPPRQS